MQLSETKREVFADWQYVPHLDRFTLCFRTDRPGDEIQIWDQRFALQGKREELLELGQELIEVAIKAGASGYEGDASCAECGDPIGLKKKPNK